jgi:hypothetical protein
VSGPHDFAVRLGVTRQRHRRVHRIPLSTFVTIAKRPSYRGGTLGRKSLIWGERQASDSDSSDDKLRH